jgi:hypothetical protein
MELGCKTDDDGTGTKDRRRRWRRFSYHGFRFLRVRWKEGEVKVKNAFLQFRVTGNFGLWNNPTRFAPPSPFETLNRSSTTTLPSERDPDHNDAQKRPRAWSEHGRPAGTRKVVRSYAPARDLDYIALFVSKQVLFKVLHGLKNVIMLSKKHDYLPNQPY